MTPPRPRTSKNRNLPENLYPNGKYWQYRNPITGKKVSINKPLAEAVKLARMANAKLAPLMVDDGALLQLLTGEQAPTITHLLELGSRTTVQSDPSRTWPQMFLRPSRRRPWW